MANRKLLKCVPVIMLVLSSLTPSAAAKLTVVIDKAEYVEKLNRCMKISPQDVTLLPEKFERRNVCFRGTLYAGRESTVVMPVEVPDGADPAQVLASLGVAISLAPPSDTNISLTEFSGSKVWVIGDLSYDRECWGSLVKPLDRYMCAPWARPIVLLRGTLVISPSENQMR
jgi:hypothetical protein